MLPHCTMDNISSISNLSNWTLSLIVGVKAALTSGAQKNIVGELPFSDLLLTIPPIPRPGDKENEIKTVLISKKSEWATMLHKSFWMKGLESLHIEIDDWGECQPHVTDKKIAPSMFYGLLEYRENVPGSGVKQVWVRTRDQIEKSVVHKSVYEYLGQRPKEILRGKTNENCIREIKGFIESLKGRMDESSVKILDRIISLIDGKPLDSEKASGAVDRLIGRIGSTCEHLNITEIHCGSTIGVNDFIELTVVALGISRALIFSDKLYNGDIIVAGYSIGTAYQILSDMTEVPSEDVTGFFASFHIETSQKMRIINRTLSDNKTLMMPVVEMLLTVVILYLSKIGPLLSMYACRQSLGPYRESALRRGSSMRWSISNIKLYHTGLPISRDDWLMSITKADDIKAKIQLWRFLLLLCCIVPFGFWWMWAPDIAPEPDIGMQRILSIIGLVGGITWLIMSMFTQTEANKNKDMVKSEKNVPTAKKQVNDSLEDLAGINTSEVVSDEMKEAKLLREERKKRTKTFLLLLIPITYITSFFSVRFTDNGTYDSWIYTWVFEIGVGILWGVGELLEGTDMGWIIESTSFYMMGILSAIRLV